MKAKKLLGIILALSLALSLFNSIPFTATAAGYDGTTYTFGNYNANIYSGAKGVSGSGWSKTDDGNLQFAHLNWDDLKDKPGVMSVCSGGAPSWNSSDRIGFECGKVYSISMEYRYLKYSADLTVSVTLLKGGYAENYDSQYDSKFFELTSSDVSEDWKTATVEYTVPDSFDSADTSNFGIAFRSNWSDWGDNTVEIKSVTVTPVKKVYTDSEGTTGYKGEVYTFENRVMAEWNQDAVPGYEWDKSNGYATLRGDSNRRTKPGVLALIPGGENGYYNDANHVGFVRGELYEITMTYRTNYSDALDSYFNEDSSVSYGIYVTLLKDGKATNYDSSYDIPLVTIKRDSEQDGWKTYTGTFKVSEDFDGDCTASGFGIVYKSTGDKWAGFDLKSVRITESKMTTDFSNYSNESSIHIAGNAALSSNLSDYSNGTITLRATNFANPEIVTEENGNKYVKFSKEINYTKQETRTAYQEGFGIVVNQAAAASYYGNKAPLENSYILKAGKTYYISLRYKLSIDSDTVSSMPVKMLKTGQFDTGCGSLSEDGITSTNNILTACDGWRTVTFTATYNTAGYQTWDSFGLGFYDESLDNINFTLCLDKVVISPFKYADGDVNEDGSVDLVDFVKLKKHTSNYATEINETIADIDGADGINASDLASLKQILLGVQKKNN